MNKEQVKKMEYARLRLRPKPRVWNQRVQTWDEVDYKWIVNSRSKKGLDLSRTEGSPRFGFILPYDSIIEFRDDTEHYPQGIKHGILMLKTQVFIKDNHLDLEPFVYGEKRQ